MTKRMIGLVAALVIASQTIALGSRDTSSLDVFSSNKVVTFDESKELTLKFWLQQLILSALYQNVVQDSSLDEWQAQLSAPTRMHCRYLSAVSLAIPERQILSFEEALLPLPSDSYPAYIFIKRGRRVQRLAKYDPWVLHKLVSETRLSLYENLSNVERVLF